MSARQAVVGTIAAHIAGLTFDHPVRVAIDGASASGKSTFAHELARAIERRGRPAIRVSNDDFHHPKAVRYRRGPLSPEGYYVDGFDSAALLDHVLKPLGPGGSRHYRRAVFNVLTDEPVDLPIETAPDDAVLVLDGMFLLRPELRNQFDFSIFLRVDSAVTLKRAEERDLALFGTVDEVRRRYEQRYIPGARLYMEAVDPERIASIVIDNTDPIAPVVRRHPAHG